jgi:hypothetical protein
MEQILPYLLTVIGFLIVFVLNGIKAEIKEIKGQLGKIEDDLHRRVTVIDQRHQDAKVDFERRLSHVEARCAMEHKS